MSTKFERLDWSFDTNIYEVNVRQYTPEGTFKAFGEHLPRLRSMGVELLWFMPITPISVEKRLGSLGSYYACSDYTSINPEFGTIDDFTKLVAAAQKLGMKVIIDWVANHTGYDHKWVKSNPEFYKKNAEGHFYDSNNWADVIDLNYYDHKMRTAMMEAMKFWINTCNIDGFRCDMAHLVPLDFWVQARRTLQELKPLFWLAETEHVNFNEAFDCVYAWNWMHDSAKYWSKVIDFSTFLSSLDFTQTKFPAPASHLFFTTNHDENSWNGTEYEKYGIAAQAFAVFTATFHGIPLIYSGQELPNKKRLLFFDKDKINWEDDVEHHNFYSTLLHLRKANPALKSGSQHSHTVLLYHTNEGMLAYRRSAGVNSVVVALNLSRDAHAVETKRLFGNDHFRDVFDELDETTTVASVIKIEPGGYRVFEKIIP